MESPLRISILLQSVVLLFGLCCCQSHKILSVNPKQNCHKSIGTASLNYLSSKRPYFYNNSLTHKYVPKGCSAVKFWYFGRHGTRNPGTDDIISMQKILPALHKEIIKAHEKDKGKLCPESVKILKSWKPRKDLNISEEFFLVKQGKLELASISRRYQARFPELFPKSFNNETYYFKYTESQRTEASAKSFAETIFGPEGANQVWFPKPEKYDPVLKFYSACPKWLEEVHKNPESNIEADKFTKSATMNLTLKKISIRAGIQRNLTLDELTIIYTSCAFESAWKNGTTSPWCVLFDLQDLQVMAYREDLKYFWLHSYPIEINYKQACPPFKDAVQFFEKGLVDRSSKKEPKGKNKIINLSKDKSRVQAYFSHSGANLKMLTRLGLYNDSVVIRSDNFKKTVNLYKWKSSEIDFMASNLAFTLYSCPNAKSGSRNSGGGTTKLLNYQIGFFVQEVPTPFPACDNKPFCPFELFRKNMAHIVDNCDLNDICAL